MPIFSLRADPYDVNKFMTCGYQHVAQWRLTGNHLTCSNFIHVDSEFAEEEQKEERKIESDSKEKIVFMCMDFICHRVKFLNNTIDGLWDRERCVYWVKQGDN